MKSSICAKTYTLLDGESLDLASFFDYFHIPANKIDISNLANGMYLIFLTDKMGNKGFQKIQKL